MIVSQVIDLSTWETRFSWLIRFFSSLNLTNLRRFAGLPFFKLLGEATGYILFVDEVYHQENSKDIEDRVLMRHT